MNVILTQDIANLGKRGEVVKVKSGYARNYLIPKKLAIVATESNKLHFTEVMRQTRARIQKQEAVALELKEKLDGEHVKLTLAFGETGKAYGSVTAKEISSAFRDKGLYFDHHQVILDQPLKEAGAHDVRIHIFGEIEATVKVWVVPEEEVAEINAEVSTEAEVESETTPRGEGEAEEPSSPQEQEEEKEG